MIKTSKEIQKRVNLFLDRASELSVIKASQVFVLYSKYFEDAREYPGIGAEIIRQNAIASKCNNQDMAAKFKRLYEVIADLASDTPETSWVAVLSVTDDTAKLTIVDLNSITEDNPWTPESPSTFVFAL